jgi:hypothetical protein
MVLAFISILLGCGVAKLNNLFLDRMKDKWKIVICSVGTLEMKSYSFYHLIPLTQIDCSSVLQFKRPLGQ